MDSKPTVAEMKDYLKDLVNWEEFALRLPIMNSPHVQMIKIEYGGCIASQKMSLYRTWLGMYPKATWRDVIEALEKTEMGNIAQYVMEMITPISHGQSLQDQKDISKWLEEGTVELSVIRINIIGPPGSGKTCTQHLLLGEPPPEATTDSTPVARSAIQAVMATIDDKNVLEKVSRDDLLERLHNHLKAQPDRNIESTSTGQNTLKATQPNMQKQKDDQPITDDIEKDDKSTVNTTSLDTTPRNEIIDEIVKCIPKTNAHISDRWFYIIDAGGLPAYQELLPLFAQRPGINIITIDLSKRSDELINVNYRANGEICHFNEKMPFSNGDFVISTIQKNRDVYKKLESNNRYSNIRIEIPSFPLHLVLGTHSDRPNSDDNQIKTESCLKTVSQCQEFRQCVMFRNLRNKEIIHPINTMSSQNTQMRQKDRHLLFKKISSNKAEMKITNMPIRWFAFQLYLQKIAADIKDSPFLTIDEVLKAGKSLEMNEKDDVLNALKFFHDANILLYYENCDQLKHIVFLNPQFIIETLSRLIALSYFEEDENIDLLTNTESTMDYQEERMNLIDFGLFSEDLLSKLKVQEPNTKKDYRVFSTDQFQPRHFIILLKHLSIICKYDETTYFLPCALRTYTDSTPHPKPMLEKLLLVWKQADNDVDITGEICVSVPLGIFPLTIIHLLRKENILFVKKDYRYRDAMSLQIENTTIFHIVNKYTHIEVYLSDNKASACHLVYEEILEAIKKSCIEISIVQPTLAFQCPSGKCKYRFVDDNYLTANCSCGQFIINENHCYFCWFNQSFTESETFVTKTRVKYIGSKPTVAEMMEYLKELVHWEPFALYLPDIKPQHVEVIKIENKDNISSQKIALYTRWLAVYPKATWRDVIEALEKDEKNEIAQHVKDQLEVSQKTKT